MKKEREGARESERDTRYIVCARERYIERQRQTQGESLRERVCVCEREREM